MTARLSFVVEIRLITDDVGTVEDFYFGTDGWTTKPGDFPANTVIKELVSDPGSYRRELFSGARVSGPNRSSFGQIVLANPDGVLDGWIGYGVSAAPVVVRYGDVRDPYPSGWTTVFKAMAQSLVVDFQQVRIVLRDRMFLLETPIVTAVGAGTGGLEGTGIAAAKKQMVFGKPGYIKPILYDQNRLMYFVQANAADERAFRGLSAPIYQVFDGGVGLTFGGYYASEADMLANSPSAGQFKMYGPGVDGTSQATYESVGPIYFRLGSPPEFDVRILSNGLLKNSASTLASKWTFSKLCNRAGMADVDISTMAAGSYDKPVGNYLVDGDQTYADVMTDACASSFASYGFDHLDKFFTLDLKDPTEGSDASAYTFTVHNAKEFVRQAVPGMEAPVWQVNVSAGKTWPGSVATGLTAEARDTFTRGPWQSVFTGTSSSVRVGNPGAVNNAIEIVGNDLQDQPARLAFVRRYIYLFGGRRDLLTLTAEFSPALTAINLHSKVTVTMPRLGCAAGRLFRVVTISTNLKARTVTYGLWGGSAGPTDAVLGGGDSTLGGSGADADTGEFGVWNQVGFISVVGAGGGSAAALDDWQQIGFMSAVTPAPAVVWDGGSGSTWTLTDSGRTAEYASGGVGVRNTGATVSRATGVSEKRYFEIVYVSSGVYGDAVRDEYGLVTTANLEGNEPSSAGIGYRRAGNVRVNSSIVVAGSALSGGDVIGVAFDLSSRKVWMSLNGTWLASGDPGAGTGQQGTLTAGTYVPGVSSEAGSDSKVTLNAITANFSYSPPSGFTGWGA